MPTLTPVDFDPFASSGAGSAPTLTPVDHDPFQEPSKALDAGKGALKGVAEGVEGLAGLPGDVQAIVNKLHVPVGAVNWARSLMGKDPISQQQSDAVDQQFQKQTLPTSAGIAQYGSDNLPAPQTSLGQHVENIAQFLPAAVGGP